MSKVVGHIESVYVVTCTVCGRRMREHRYSWGAFRNQHVFSCDVCTLYFQATSEASEIKADAWGAFHPPSGMAYYANITAYFLPDSEGHREAVDYVTSERALLI